MRFAIEICEDAWVAMPPSAAHALAGANVIFNLSASNSVIGKKQYREMLVRSHSFTGHCAYVFSSAGVGESTTDTVYSGHVLVAENGSMLLNETAQEFESKIYYTELDLERLEADRKRLTTFHATAGLGKYLKIAFDGRRDCFEQLTRNVSDQPFVPRLASDRDRRLNEIFTILYLALAKRLHHTGLKHPVIGISGGLDSTLALLIIAKAMDQLGWDHSNIIAVTMPGFGTTGRTYQNAVKLMQLLGTTVKEINITDAVSQHFKDIGHDPENLDVTYENAQARERMQILMDIANQQNGLVIGTGDLSELALGWATYAGDHIAMYNVNSGVPKTLVRHLVRWIADHFEEEAVRKVLYDVLETPVSPELLPADAEGKIAQKTEEILGDYILHDFFIYYFLRFGFTGDKILFLAETAFAGTYSRAHIKETLLTFFERFFKHQFKRSCMPDGPENWFRYAVAARRLADALRRVLGAMEGI